MDKSKDEIRKIHIQLEIAKLLGWKGIHLRNKKNARSHNGQFPWGIGPNGEWSILKGQDCKYSRIPNYPEDLNACVIFEKSLPGYNELPLECNLHRYGDYLINVCGSVSNAFIATPLQRCEAFLRVNKRWI